MDGQRIYFDNAATTPLKEEVWLAMEPYLKSSFANFGNPSSTHAFGRETKAAIEKARKNIAQLMGAAPAEIFFTSGGTEADNTAIVSSVYSHDIKHIITSPLEHHAVTHTVDHLCKSGDIQQHHVKFDEKGVIDLDHLKSLVSKYPKSLVSLMHGNNEIGNILPIEEVMEICAAKETILHSDTVQTVGHFPIKLSDWNIQHIAAAAHKFHGPKGIGFLYIQSGHTINPYVHGGAQERNMRGGTENVAGIIGLAKALEIALADLDSKKEKIVGIKNYMKEKLIANIPGVSFNGQSADENSLYTVLNISLPPTDKNEMLLFSLDIKGIACSGGSACSSGSNLGSHVLTGIGVNQENPAIRFSFSEFNTKEEVDQVVSVLKGEL